MRTLIVAALSLPLVLLGIHQVQGEGMEKKGEEMKMVQPMKSDGMMDSEKMKSDDMMHSDGMKKKMMEKEHKMAPKREYKVPTDAELREILTPLQYRVTREEGTEPAFNNRYWDNHEAGIYVDIISGVPLFSSTDKYDSGTGWPSFTRPIDEDSVYVTKDRSFFMVRNEVRSKLADAHLGHVFDDGPKPTGLRYCMNSASLRFVPVDELEQQGYGEYLKLFK